VGVVLVLVPIKQPQVLMVVILVHLVLPPQVEGVEQAATARPARQEMVVLVEVGTRETRRQVELVQQGRVTLVVLVHPAIPLIMPGAGVEVQVP